MASSSTEAPPLPTLRDVIRHGDDDHFIAEEEEEDDDEEEEWDMSKRMSRLSMEGSDGGDADDEDGGDNEEEEQDDEFEARSDVNAAAATYRPWPPSSASLPGTPDRGHGGAQVAQSSSPWWAGPIGGKDKEYASETEARWPPDADGRGGRRHHRRRHRQQRAQMAREVWLERAWRMRKQRRQLQEEVPVVVLGAGGGGGDSPARGVAMDMEEVRACRDLGLALPCDWTVEIPCYAAALSGGVDSASSGGNSPASGSWRISSPGDDPKDVKARLKVWAQAVALASASRLGS